MNRLAAQEPKPVGAVYLLGPKMKDWEAALTNYSKTNDLPLVVIHDREPTPGDFDLLKAKARVEVGTVRTLTDWRYALEFGLPYRDARSGDFYYPYALHYYDAIAKKSVTVLKNAMLFAHWNEPLPQQLPRLVTAVTLREIRDIVAPQILSGEGVTAFREPVRSYRGPPVATYFPIKTNEVAGVRTAEIVAHNRLPFAISIRVSFHRTFAGDYVTTLPQELKAGEKRTIVVKPAIEVRSASLASFNILDPELQPRDPPAP